jgi:hypothetical protein
MATTLRALELAYTPLELTILAQALPRYDTGEELLWDTFLPRADVDSVDLQTVTTLDYRPAADRREWNARGRRIPLVAPTRRQVTIVPIEANDKIDEKQMQTLSEGARGNWDTVKEIIGSSLPQRTQRLAMANYRRLEIDAFQAWTAGTITQRNPENAAQTYTASFGFSSARYTTAGTAWDNVGVNAYALLLAWIAAAEDLVGPIEGVMLRLATLNAILADAPNLPNAVTMTRSALADRISEDIGEGFEFYVNENSVDVFDDGGLTYTRTKIWPAQKIAAIPRGKVIGQTAFAPVRRAMELEASANAPGGVDVRGCTVYYDSSNGGRELDIECQLNACPVPDEQKLYVTNVGV